MLKSLLAAALAAGCLTGEAMAQPGGEPIPTGPGYTTSDADVPVGGFALSTRLYAPVRRERYPVILLIPGSGTDRTTDAVYTQILARAFAAQGIGALAYDKRGSGQSTGTFTGSDFRALGADAAALARYAQGLPQVESVGVWGISQAGWIAPEMVRRSHNLAFAILVSPAGVSPFDQVSYFLRRQTSTWGLSEDEGQDAERMHRAVGRYYAGRASYRSAQNVVDSYRDRRWFHQVVTHPYWDEMTPEGQIKTPAQLGAALTERPGDFEIYRAPSSFGDYASSYRTLRRLPTLIVYGGADELVPIALSQPIFERAFVGERRHAHEFRVFEGASHDIQTADGQVMPDYLAVMAAWARAQFDARR